MSDEWVLIEIARWVSLFILLGIGYFVGIKSQKMHALREYITGVVEDNYPALFDEIRRNSGLLDNYLENPFAGFQFPKLKAYGTRDFLEL
jgi:hypothetical protein